MNQFECSQLEKALREEDSALLREARVHALTCAECSRELESWDSISVGAAALKQDWPTPWLWSRIQESLSSEMQPKNSFWPMWRFAFGAAAVVLLAISAFWTVTRSRDPQLTDDRHFLTEQALKDVERSEAAYVQSIEKLSQLAASVMEGSSSPLLNSYSEKLALLDAAIAELRQDSEHNVLNAQLRLELVNLYKEKQKTLTEVLRHANDATRAR